MLKMISINIELICPNCGTEAKHDHSFEIQSTIDEFNSGELSSIGYTKQLYESALNFNCPKCNCWHSVEIDPIEVHVEPTVTVPGFTVTHEKVYIQKSSEPQFFEQ